MAPQLLESIWQMIGRVVDMVAGLLGSVASMLRPVTSVISGIPCLPYCIELTRCTTCCCSNWCMIGMLNLIGYMGLSIIMWFCPCNPWVSLLCYPQLAGYVAEMLEPCIELCTF